MSTRDPLIPSASVADPGDDRTRTLERVALDKFRSDELRALRTRVIDEVINKLTEHSCRYRPGVLDSIMARISRVQRPDLPR